MASIDQLLTMGLAHGADTTRFQTGFVQASRRYDQLQWEDVLQALTTLPAEERAALCIGPAAHLITGAELAQLTNTLWLRLRRHDARAGTYKAKTPILGQEVNEDDVSDARQATIVRVALQEFIDPKVCRTCKGAGRTLQH